MRVATINVSGNVGKTTIAKNLLYPRMPGARIFEIETVNTGLQLKTAEITTLRASSYGALADELILAESAIVDVGASNVEGFFKEMAELDGSHEDIDYFLIPCVRDEKIIKETAKTAIILGDLGVPSEKIKVVFNRVPKDVSVSETFAPIFKMAKDRRLSASEGAAIYENPIYEALNKLSISLAELNADATDYRGVLKDAKNEAEQKRILAMIANKRRAGSATANLDAVFVELFGEA